MDLPGLISLVCINSIFVIGAVGLPSFHSETSNGSTLIMPLTEGDTRIPLTSNSSFAKRWCSNINSSLPRITNESDQKNIVQFIRNATTKHQLTGIENIFVNNINHTLYDNWTWVNGQPNQGFTVKQISKGADGYFFGHLWTGNYRILESRPLEIRRYICETSATLSDSSLCEMRVGNRCYWKQDVMLTWYKAREACFNEGGDLASFEMHNDRILKVALKDLGLIESRSYWVGIQKGVWQWNDTGKDSEIKYSKWKANHPSNYNAKCLCLSKQPNNDYEWIECECNTSYPCICKRNGTSGQIQLQTKRPQTTSLVLKTTARSSSVGQTTNKVKMTNTLLISESRPTVGSLPMDEIPNTAVISETAKLAIVLSSCALAVVVVISVVAIFIIRKRKNRTETTPNTNELSIYEAFQERRGDDAVYAALQQRISRK